MQETDSFKQSPEQKAFVMAEYQKQMDEYERAKQSALSGENTVKYLTPRLSVEETVKAIQANVKASGANSPEAIQAAVFDTFAGMPNPAPLNDAILERIAEKMAEKAIPTTAPSVPFHQQSGETGIHNPVLGTEEEHFPLPLQTPVSACTVQVKQDAPVSPVSTCTVQVIQEGKPFTESTYEQLKRLIVARELAPQFRPVKAVLKEWGIGSSDAQRQKMAAAALGRMNEEGILKPNDEISSTGKLKAKYILS